ncbi:MAG: cysteine desulfurase [Candidatus Moranbacteria bacterium]|nr:cysteine desulfurase [Candidatus Moranbacteria bacterium]
MDNSIKNRFPIFVARPGLVYLDSGATALKPDTAIEAVSGYYRDLSANVGRGLYRTAEETSARFETVRERAARFVGADPEEIVFTRNTTEGINLLEYSLADRVTEGDTIVVTALEHHSNFLPWKRLAKRSGTELRIVPFDIEGHLNPDSLREHIDGRTKIFAFSAVSNVLGSVNDVTALIRAAKAINPGIITVVDAAQAAGHMAVDAREWDCDFLALSGHKMYGPTGVGLLYGKTALLRTLEPYQVGGGMILDSTSETPVYMDAPQRFEAGTPDIAAVLGLEAAIGFVEEIGTDAIHSHEIALATKAAKRLTETFGDSIRILGPATRENGIISFTMDGIHPHDIAQVLGERDICIRAGEHCASPLHRELGIPASARASFSVYNTETDIDRLIEGLKGAVNLFKK